MNTQPRVSDIPAPAKRIHYLDVLRFFAMLTVVLIHVVAPAWYAVPAESAAWKTLNLYDSASRFAVPLFVAISGALFRPERPVDLKKLYLRKISRLAVAWVFWSLVYASRFLFTGDPAGRVSAFWTALYQGNYHLWFIPMMIGLYMITPLLAPVLSDRKKTLYLLLLSFVTALLLPTLSLVPALSFLKALPETLYLYLPLGYVFYFALGSLLHREPLSSGLTALVYALGVFGVLVTVFGTAHLSHGMNHYEYLYGYLTPNVAFETAAVFLLVKNAYKKRADKYSARRLRFFAMTAKLTFGAYLTHEICSILLAHFHISAVTCNPTWFVPVLVLLVAAFGYVISYCIHKIPILRDWIV